MQLAFNHGRIVSFVYPLTALALSTVGSLAVQIVMTAFEREQVRDVFTRFVPESVVAEVLKRTDSDLRLGGVAVEGTVLFTDLRGFTTASEHLSPAQVLELINRHLEEVVGAVLDHGGTLVSYTGDGIFAVFGAPIEQADHAAAGLRRVAARSSPSDSPAGTSGSPSRASRRGFRMGIGLNSGPFMSGNIGSAQRLAYTAMGDTINTASRIEQMTKTTGHMLLVAGSTRDELDEARMARLVYIDEVEVRGRTSKLPLWGLPEDGAVQRPRGRRTRTRLNSYDRPAVVARRRAPARVLRSGRPPGPGRGRRPALPATERRSPSPLWRSRGPSGLSPRRGCRQSSP